MKIIHGDGYSSRELEGFKVRESSYLTVYAWWVVLCNIIGGAVYQTCFSNVVFDTMYVVIS